MKKLLKSYGIVTVGSVILAFAFDAFYAPNQMAMGGITGMAQVVNALIPSVTVGVATFLLNVPLFLAGFLSVFHGGKFAGHGRHRTFVDIPGH